MSHYTAKMKKAKCYGRDFYVFTKSHFFFLQAIWLDYISQPSLWLCGACD